MAAVDRLRHPMIRNSPEVKRFIIWDPSDGSPFNAFGERVSGGVLGEIDGNNVYLKVYAKYPDGTKLDELQVMEHITGVEFSLSGEKGTYDVYRVL